MLSVSINTIFTRLKYKLKYKMTKVSALHEETTFTTFLKKKSYATIYERAKRSDKAKDNGKYAYFKSGHHTSPNMFIMHNGLVNSGYRSHLFS